MNPANFPEANKTLTNALVLVVVSGANKEFEMNTVDFPEANKTLTKPDGMTDEECGSLPVYTNGIECISCWRPTPRERLSILLFGKIWLRILSGQTQPPVALSGRKTILG